MRNSIERLLENKQITYTDYYFADFIARINSQKQYSDPLFFISAILSHQTLMEKHTCLDISSKENFAELLSNRYSIVNISLDNVIDNLRYCDVVGNPGDYQPLILDENLLYLHRNWHYENQLAKKISQYKNQTDEVADLEQLGIALRELFHEEGQSGINWQMAAAFLSVRERFSVITGGPGTGKTTVIANILALLLKLTPNELKIKICAPTGKAVSQIQNSILEVKQKLTGKLSPDILAKIPAAASTIHRLLKPIRHSPHFKHDSKNPLDVDILIIDEASMISLNLLAKLLDAVPEQAKIILLGDKDQLASVESGAVFADICSCIDLNMFSQELFSEISRVTGKEMPGRCTSSPKGLYGVELLDSYRFNPNLGIGKLKNAVNQGNFLEAIEIIKSDNEEEIFNWSYPLDQAQLTESLRNLYQKGFGGSGDFLSYSREQNIESAYYKMMGLGILCSHRRGIYGVENINKLITTQIFKVLDVNSYFMGKPIMILENSPIHQLYNGDIGLCWPDSKGVIKVFFPSYGSTHDGSDKLFREFLPGQLPAHETVFAMTVHKSQGSGFENVLIILPPEDSPLLTRELIYTSITRAKKRCMLWVNPKNGHEILKSAIKRKTLRNSGLKNKISEFRGL